MDSLRHAFDRITHAFGSGHRPRPHREPLGDGEASAVRRPSHPRPGSVDSENPLLGEAHPAPDLVAGDLRSPVFLGTEAEYFREARRVIDQAKPGDKLCVQMYEFENLATHADAGGADKAPGFADQQALLPGLAAAARRGVDVDVILDASHPRNSDGRMNQPILDYLSDQAGRSGHIQVDFYPPESVNIDHAKELIHLTPTAGGAFAVDEALAGGSNWGNHTPANDDGGGAFYGRDAMGAARIFFRDQTFCRGEREAAPNPAADETGPVRWAVTAPSDEGGGSAAIRDAKLALTRDADEVYLNQFCLTHHDLLAATAEKGANAHVRLDPNELAVNRSALGFIRDHGGEAMWANTAMDPDMEGQKNHEKLDVYVKGGVPVALTIGSANDTSNGLESTFSRPSPSTGKPESHKTNHEIDAIVSRATDGAYSTAPFLDAALAKTRHDLAEKSLEKPPSKLSGTAPGQF
jgi:hypothetical protein